MKTTIVDISGMLSALSARGVEGKGARAELGGKTVLGAASSC